jgi:hypothetical protein
VQIGIMSVPNGIASAQIGIVSAPMVFGFCRRFCVCADGFCLRSKGIMSVLIDFVSVPTASRLRRSVLFLRKQHRVFAR